MRRFPLDPSRSPARQSGATLVIAMLILVLIMMIGVTAISTSNTQFRLAGNLQFEDGAINNAEAAIADAERRLFTSDIKFDDPAFTTADAARPYLIPRVVPPAVRTDTTFTTTWSAANAFVMTDAAAQPDVTRQYRIEQMSVNSRLQGSSQVVGGRASSGCNQVNTFLITGRGQSGRGATKFVQSYYGVLSCAV